MPRNWLSSTSLRSRFDNAGLVQRLSEANNIADDAIARLNDQLEDQKRVEQALQEATDRVEALIAASPLAIIELLNREIVTVVRAPDINDKFLAEAVIPVGSSPAEFAAHIRKEHARIGNVIRSSTRSAAEAKSSVPDSL